MSMRTTVVMYGMTPIDMLPVQPEPWPPVDRSTLPPGPDDHPTLSPADAAVITSLMGPTRAEFQSAIESVRAALRDHQEAFEAVIAEVRAIAKAQRGPEKVTVGWRLVSVQNGGVRWYSVGHGPAGTTDKRAKAFLYPTEEEARRDASDWKTHYGVRLVRVTRKVK